MYVFSNCDVMSLIETGHISWQRWCLLWALCRTLHFSEDVCCSRRHDLPSDSPSSKNTAFCSQVRLLQSQGLPLNSISRECLFLLRFNTRDQFHVLGSRNQLRRLFLSSRYCRLGIMTTSNDKAWMRLWLSLRSFNLSKYTLGSKYTDSIKLLDKYTSRMLWAIGDIFGKLRKWVLLKSIVCNCWQCWK